MAQRHPTFHLLTGVGDVEFATTSAKAREMHRNLTTLNSSAFLKSGVPPVLSTTLFAVKSLHRVNISCHKTKAVRHVARQTAAHFFVIFQSETVAKNIYVDTRPRKKK